MGQICIHKLIIKADKLVAFFKRIADHRGYKLYFKLPKHHSCYRMCAYLSPPPSFSYLFPFDIFLYLHSSLHDANKKLKLLQKQCVLDHLLIFCIRKRRGKERCAMIRYFWQHFRSWLYNHILSVGTPFTLDLLIHIMHNVVHIEYTLLYMRILCMNW